MKAPTMQLKTFEVNPQLLFFVHLSSQQMDEAWWPCWNLSASASAWRWIMWSGSLQSPSTGASQCSSRWALVKRSSPHFLPTHHQLSHIMAFLADALLKMFRYQTNRLKSMVTKYCFFPSPKGLYICIYDERIVEPDHWGLENIKGDF